MFFQHDSQPERLEPPPPPRAVDVDALDGEIIGREAQHLALPGTPVAEPKGEIERRHVEPEKAQDRPNPKQDRDDPDQQAERPEEQHHHAKAVRRQTAVRQQNTLEKDRGIATHGYKIGRFAGARKRLRPRAGDRTAPAWLTARFVPAASDTLM